MKKSYKWVHDKWNEEEHPRDQQRQRSNTEEHRKFSKHVSSRCEEDYFEDENKSVGYQRNSYQMERRSKTTIETFQVIPPGFEPLSKGNSKKVNWTKNYTEDQRLNDAVKSTKEFEPEENYKVRQGVHPLCPQKGNSYPDSKNQIFRDISTKPVDVRMKFENKFLQVDATETRRNSNEISINEENPSKNDDMKHIHSSNENSLPVLQRSFYESNQSTQYYSKQYDDQSNTNSHDLSKNNVCTYKERSDSQSDNTYNDSQRTAFLSCSAPHERNEFITLKLIDLLYYNANLMLDQSVFNFSVAIKCKILEVIDIFPSPVREELEILCEITDGDQSAKNQQIITTRTCRIARNIIEKFPHLLNTLKTSPPPPPTQILVNQKSPFFKIVQNSEVVLTSTTDCNFMSDYKIVQNDKCVISKTISESSDNKNPNGYEIHNFNTNDVENNSTINSPLIVEENKNIVEESSKHHSPPPVNSEENKPVNRFSFNEDDNCFAAFTLDKLLNFNINAMHGDVIFEYAFSMKQRISEKINCFEDPYKDKLKLLCELTDGTQREHNQKLINQRMYDLIYDIRNEIGEDNWENFLKGLSKDVCTKQSNDEKEMLHGHRQNIDGQSRKTHPRRSHDEDEEMNEHNQNFTDEQSRNAHSRRPHKVIHEHRRNFSDVQSRNPHSRSLEAVPKCRQKFSVEQSRRSHEVAYELNQNFSDGQSKDVHARQLYDEVMNVHRQNFTGEQSKKVQSRRLHYGDEMVQHEHRRNFSDGQSRNVHLRRSHFKDGTEQ